MSKPDPSPAAGAGGGGRHPPFRGGRGPASGVSQPSVSAAVSGLETALGVQLVSRSSRKVALTPAGAEAAASARRALAEVDSMAELGTGRRRWADGGPCASV